MCSLRASLRALQRAGALSTCAYLLEEEIWVNVRFLKKFLSETIVWEPKYFTVNLENNLIECSLIIY